MGPVELKLSLHSEFHWIPLDPVVRNACFFHHSFYFSLKQNSTFHALSSDIKKLPHYNSPIYVEFIQQTFWHCHENGLAKTVPIIPCNQYVSFNFQLPTLNFLVIFIKDSGGHFKSCRFITVMSARLKVPAKNSPALLFLSRGKEEERKTTTISCFSPAEEEQSRGIFGGNIQTRAHDGDKAAGLKVTT